MKGEPITEYNLEEYVKQAYPDSQVNVSIHGMISVFEPFRQQDYGDEYDCSITSIASCIKYILPNEVFEDVYRSVEVIASRYGYNGKTTGTPFYRIKKIYQECSSLYNLKDIRRERWIKGLGVNMWSIAEQIDRGRPVILSMWKDNRNFYKDHTVTIIGYKSYLQNNGKCVHFLEIYDNWDKSVRYLDFQRLSSICSVIY